MIKRSLTCVYHKDMFEILVPSTSLQAALSPAGSCARTISVQQKRPSSHPRGCPTIHLSKSSHFFTSVLRSLLIEVRGILWCKRRWQLSLRPSQAGFSRQRGGG